MNGKKDPVLEKIEFQSKSRLNMLKARSKRCVCKYCGGSLKVRQIILSSYEDARIELFCSNCNRIEFGVEPEIFLSAKSFVEESGFNAFKELDDNEKTKQMTIAKACELITWQNQNIGILTSEGYQIPIKENPYYDGKCTILTDNDLENSDWR